MKQLRPLIITALLANLVTGVLYRTVISLPVGSGMDFLYMIVWMPVLWVTTLIATIIILFIKRKSIFQKSILAWTLLTLIFTTPLPVLAIYHLTHLTPETRSAGESYVTTNGKIYKSEFWERTLSHKKFVYKHFVADSAQEATFGDKAYKKDSTWIYFDINGDTSKLEYYKYDTLMLTKQFKKQ